MREIKFRAWDKRKNQMRLNVHLAPYFEELLQDEWLVVMQFTGLKDKNDKEIYEGDLIRWAGRKMVVEWHNGGFGVAKPHLHKPKQKGWNWIGSIADIEEDVEVIGNIYENPELLNQNL